MERWEIPARLWCAVFGALLGALVVHDMITSPYGLGYAWAIITAWWTALSSQAQATLISALVALMVACLTYYAATRARDKLERKRESERDERERHALAAAIMSELHNVYLSRVDLVVRLDFVRRKAMDMHWSEYFLPTARFNATVYEACADKIALLGGRLAAGVIRTYGIVAETNSLMDQRSLKAREYDDLLAQPAPIPAEFLTKFGAMRMPIHAEPATVLRNHFEMLEGKVWGRQAELADFIGGYGQKLLDEFWDDKTLSDRRAQFSLNDPRAVMARPRTQPAT